MNFTFSGNRWKGTFAAELGHDDAVHGPEAGTSVKDLQSGEPGQGTPALVVWYNLNLLFDLMTTDEPTQNTGDLCLPGLCKRRHVLIDLKTPPFRFDCNRALCEHHTRTWTSYISMSRSCNNLSSPANTVLSMETRACVGREEMKISSPVDGQLADACRRWKRRSGLWSSFRDFIHIPT